VSWWHNGQNAAKFMIKRSWVRLRAVSLISGYYKDRQTILVYNQHQAQLSLPSPGVDKSSPLYIFIVSCPGRLTTRRTRYYWNEFSTDSQEWFQRSINYHMKKASGSWIYGLLKSGGTVLIFYRFSRCTKDYLQYPSAAFLLSVYSWTYCQDCEKPMSAGHKTVLLFFQGGYWSLEPVTAKCYRLWQC